MNHTLFCEELTKTLIHSLPVDCCVLHHSALALLCGVPIKLIVVWCSQILISKYIWCEKLQINSSDDLYVSWMHFCDENIKCIHTSPFDLIFWHCVAFFYEEGGRRVGQNWARAKTAKLMSAKLPWPQWLVLKWISEQKLKITLVLTIFLFPLCAAILWTGCKEGKQGRGMLACPGYHRTGKRMN